jgi:hypothetical protein
VVLAILLILLGLLLPAIAKVRSAAMQAQTTNNLKQLALAMHNHNDVYNFLPPGVDDNHYSAASKLLPFIEQDNLYKLIDFKKPIDDKANATVRAARIKTFLSPRDPILTVHNDCGATNYLYNDMVFGLNTKARIPNSFPDGTSNTIVIGETLKGDGGTRAVDVRRQYVRLKKSDLKGLKDDAGVKSFKDNQNIAGDRCACWIDGRFLMGTFNGRLRPNDPRPDVSCEGEGGVSALRAPNEMVYVALADGSVRGINAKRISLTTWRNAINPADGNPLGDDW